MAMEPHALVSINVFVCQYSIQILLCMALVDDTVLNTVTIFHAYFPFLLVKINTSVQKSTRKRKQQI